MPLNVANFEDVLTTDGCTKKLLDPILNLNLNDEKCETTIVNNINSLLSSAKTRNKGLECLNLVIKNCSTIVSTENAFFWLCHCLVKQADDPLREIKLETCRKIIEQFHANSEFSKKFISDFISKIFETCLATTYVSVFSCEAALKLLTKCMKYYGSWFGYNRSRIENFLLHFLVIDNENLVENAALAFHFLQQVGGAGTDGVLHRNTFSKNFEKMCSTAHRLLDGFFKNEKEFESTVRDNVDYFEFQELSVDSEKMMHVTSTRLRNCLKFLEIMIRTRFPVPKETKPKSLLDVIVRGLSLHHCLSAEGQIPLKTYQFSLLLNQLQIQLLNLLRWAIVWYGPNILPFSYVINKLLVDCLKRTQSCNCFKSDSIYQESIYKVLQQWLVSAKNSLPTRVQNQLIGCILKDITPFKSRLKLSISDEHKSMPKKARQKAMNEKIISSAKKSANQSNSTNLERTVKENTCKLALGTLRTMFTTNMIKADEPLIEELYNTVLSSLQEIQTSKSCHPYTDTDCQLKLYQVLVSFYEQHNLKTYLPLNKTISILTVGVNSRNRFIALTCEEGLNVLEKFCQPLCPSLYLKADVGDQNSRLETFEDSQENVYDEEEPQSQEDNRESQENNLCTSPEETVQDEQPKVNIIEVLDITDRSMDSTPVEKEEEIVVESSGEIENDNSNTKDRLEDPEISVDSENESYEETVINVEEMEAKDSTKCLVEQSETIIEVDDDDSPPSKKAKVEESEIIDDAINDTTKENIPVKIDEPEIHISSKKEVSNEDFPEDDGFVDIVNDIYNL